MAPERGQTNHKPEPLKSNHETNKTFSKLLAQLLLANTGTLFTKRKTF